MNIVSDINTAVQANATGVAGGSMSSTGNGLRLDNYGNKTVRFQGSVGGDLAINTGANGSLSIGFGVEPKTQEFSSKEYNVILDHGYTNEIKGGTVIGGVGGSAAAALGNVEIKDLNVSASLSHSGPTIASVSSDSLKLDGKTSTTVNGDVETKVEADANLIGFMNGGLAAGIGGEASSTINGSTTITINSDGGSRKGLTTDEVPGGDDFLPQMTNVINMMNGSGVNAIGVTGGGAALTTIGGEATSTVTGSTTINVNDATVIGAVGGGVAGAADITGAAEYLLNKNNNVDYGKNDETVDVDLKTQVLDKLTGILPDKITVNGSGQLIVHDAIQGGTAISKTGDTYINVNGTSTAAGVIGGGAAVASHTYLVRDPDENASVGKVPEGYTAGSSYGKAEATAETGKSHITIALTSQLSSGEDKKAMLDAAGNFAGQLADPGQKIESGVLESFSNKGAAIGVFGGGIAIAHGDTRQFAGNAEGTLSTTDGAFATATTAGSEINLRNGYIAGVMGGGVAGAINNATATAEMTDTVDITIGGSYQDEAGNVQEGNPEVVGLFGNGLAYYTGSGDHGDNHLKGVATTTAKSANFNVLSGSVDGIIGGGLAIDDSQSDTVNAIAKTTDTTSINVAGGKVNKVDAYAALEGIFARGDIEVSESDMASYVAGVEAAAGNAAIAAGGIALGGGADAYVKDAVVNIAGGEVTGDIYGGGIAAYGTATGEADAKTFVGGSHVGTSIINLHGFVKEDGSNTTTITGNVYAGGAVSADDNRTNHQTDRYESANATVDNATVNLAGAQVNGILYGTGTVDQEVLADTATEDQKAQVAVKESTLNLLGQNTLSNQITVGTGDTAITQTASKIQDYTNVMATAGSETILDADYVTGTALIDGGKMTAESGAYLNIDAQAKKSSGTETYLVASNMAEGSQLWKDDAFTYDRMGTVYADDVVGDDGSYSVEFKTVEGNEAEAAASMAGRLGADELQNSLKEAMGNWNNGNKVNQAARDYIYDWQMSSNPGLYKRGMMIGEDAAVTGNTVSIARDMADNVMQRLSFTDDYVQDAGWVNNDGGIWAKYIHRKYETEGMGSSFGGIRSSTDYDGAIVGVDFAKHGNFQSGVAFHYGSGDGNGLISRNDYDAWGFTLYGSLKDEEAGTNLMADIGYVTSDNDIDGTVENYRLSADRDVDAWTIGLRGEKEYVFGQNQLVPYVGLRYMSVNPARYSVSVDGKSTFGMDADNQNLWLLPIGVSFRNETVTDGGWRITPKLDLSYIWAFGDTDTDVDVNFVDGVSSGLYYDVMDDNSWLASLGVEATKDVWSFGVGYGYQKGDDTKNKTWFVNASYAF